MEMTAANASIILIVFTIIFILMDEYVAKPIRRKRLEARRDRDPEARKLLEVAEKAAQIIAEREKATGIKQ
jgi:flagellar biosynthesis/type III secretory pathway M-ring protein FliF/YscJ